MNARNSEAMSLLANQWFSELLRSDGAISLEETVSDMEKELRTGNIARMYEGLSLKNEEDRRFLDVVSFARALRRGDFEEANTLKMRLLGLD
jgi:hypothetical protein